jgi:hypothetical protein
MPIRCEQGHHTMSAAFDVAQPEGSAWLDDCGETNDDAAAENDSSILLACTGAARKFLRVRMVGSGKAD